MLTARLPRAVVASKELFALAGNQLIPMVPDTTDEALLNVSPMLLSRSGLATAQYSMAAGAIKSAERVAVAGDV